MNGKPYICNKFAYELRLQLWCEHLDISLEEKHIVNDVLDNFVYNDLWKKISSSNTLIYNTVFTDIPQNKWKTLDKILVRVPLETELLKV